MRRRLALWFPFLPTDRARRTSSDEQAEAAPFALAEKAGGALRLFAIDAASAALGLAPGLTLADARARVPHLAVAPADPAADVALLARIGAYCDRFTPWVALDPPDGLILDISGCAHLFGGEAALRAHVCAALQAHGVQVRAAIADNGDLACALARFSDVAITEPAQEELLARALPIAALRASPAIKTALSRAGLKTVGAVADRGAQALTARFGAAFADHVRALLGEGETPRTPLRAPPVFRIDRAFAEPLAHMDAIMAALEDLIGALAGLLERQGQGGRDFEASFFRADGAVRRITAQTAQPVRDPSAILRLFRERLDVLADPIDPGFGFDSMRLAALQTEPLRAAQVDLDGHETGRADVGELVDRLTARFGRTRVLRCAPRSAHDPVRAVRFMPALAFDAPDARSVWPTPQAGEPPLRPLQLFEPPQPIEALAEAPDGPPLRFRWRRLAYDVVRSEGPERLEPEWWRAPDAGVRDYYRIEDAEGRRFWVFREGHYGASPAPRWFVHGLFA